MPGLIRIVIMYYISASGTFQQTGYPKKITSISGSLRCP